MYLQVEGINLEEMQEALRDAPDLAYKFVRREMVRIGNRFKKRLKKEHMSGRPGIKATQLGPGQTKVFGNKLTDLKLVGIGGPVLALHEKGGPITAPPGKALAIPLPGVERLHGRGSPTQTFADLILLKRPGLLALLGRRLPHGGFQAMYVLHRSVYIPPRLGYKALWNEMMPENLAKLEGEIMRAMHMSMERKMKIVSRAFARAVA